MLQTGRVKVPDKSKDVEDKEVKAEQLTNPSGPILVGGQCHIGGNSILNLLECVFLGKVVSTDLPGPCGRLRYVLSELVVHITEALRATYIAGNAIS